MNSRSIALKEYITALLSNGLREGGRKLDEYRKISIEVNPLSQANGSARVHLGETEVIVGVKVGVGTPYPDSPEEGILTTSAELTPIASEEFEPGPPREDSIELARVVDRAIRESKLIKVEELCIKKHEKVWMVFLDIYPINSDGNLLDASTLGAVVALKNTFLPKYNEKEDIVEYRELTKKKLPLTDNYPVLCTFGKIKEFLFVDPSKQEQENLDSQLSIAITAKGDVCAMQKSGEGYFTETEIYALIERAIKKSKELRKHIK